MGEYRSVQLRIADLEEKTGLDFGPFRSWDVLGREDATESFTDGAQAVVLESVEDVVL